MGVELVLFSDEKNAVNNIGRIPRLYVDWDKKKAHFINGDKAKELIEAGEIKVTFEPVSEWRKWAEKKGLKIEVTDIGTKLKKRKTEDKGRETMKIGKSDIGTIRLSNDIVKKRETDETPSKQRAE